MLEYDGTGREHALKLTVVRTKSLFVAVIEHTPFEHGGDVLVSGGNGHLGSRVTVRTSRCPYLIIFIPGGQP